MRSAILLTKSRLGGGFRKGAVGKYLLRADWEYELSVHLLS